jgi:hypothetical protein
MAREESSQESFRVPLAKKVGKPCSDHPLSLIKFHSLGAELYIKGSITIALAFIVKGQSPIRLRLSGQSFIGSWLNRIALPLFQGRK